MRSEVGLFVFQAEFLPNVLSVEVHRIHRKIQDCGYVFCCLAFLDQGGHFNFPRGKIQILGRQMVQEGRDNIIEV